MTRGRELRIDRSGPLRRAAVLEAGRLTDLYVDRSDRPALTGAVLLGKVGRIAAGLNGAFVELGAGGPGLLAVADLRRDGRAPARDARIGTLLRTGQPVLVQVKGEGGGGKGPTLTQDVTLPGRFLVHAPAGEGIAVSRRLGRGPERARMMALMRDVGAPGGWIVRADAAEAPPDLIALEAEALAALWRDLQARAAGAAAPALLLAAPTAAQRALAEQGAGLAALRVDGAEAAAEVAAWCRGRAPDLERLLERHAGPQPLFEQDDLEGAIAGLLRPRVPLPGGGSVVIERTEALVAIDVNGGERGDAVAVNLEAAQEVARQLRLRNLGGIIVIDFINMSRAGDGERIVQALSGAVADDPGSTHVYGISKLGLVEMTRSRRGPSLADVLAGVSAPAAAAITPDGEEAQP
jgi:ribonuclease E/ribonuclease G